MIYILDSQDVILGILDNRSKSSCTFSNDVRTHKIADDTGKIWSETLTLEVPYGYAETELLDNGMQLLIGDDNSKWKLFTIYNTEDSINGISHVKKIEAINSCIWKMYHTYLEERTWSAANSQDIFSYIFQRSGWILDDFNDFFNGGLKSYTVSEGNSQAALDAATKEFDVEIDAYVTIKNGHVVEKRILLTDTLGTKTGQRFEYRKNLVGATRTRTNLEFFTKLYVFGGQNAKGKRASIVSVNKQKVPGTNRYEYQPYILDDEANDTYNDGNAYLEGYIVNEDIVKPEGLLTWGKRQMEIYNHPKYNYSVDVALLGTRPAIGDTIAVVDFEMSPPLTISARVLETNYSESDPRNDSVVLGEYVTINAVTPNEVWKLQALASQALQASQGSKTWKVELFTPEGLDFTTDTEKKQIIVRVFEGNENITSKIPKEGFVWEMLDVDGAHVEEWELEKIGAGNIITVGHEVSGYTIRCSVNDETTKPAIFAEEKDFSFFCRLQNEPNEGDNDFNYRVAQYAQVDPDRKEIYWTQIYSGSALTAAEIAAGESYSITRTTLDGTILDRMICKNGGHGSHFGIKYENGKMYIYIIFKDISSNKPYFVKFPYTPGKILKWGDPTIKIIYQTTTRVNYDVANGYYLISSGTENNAVFKIVDSDTLNAGKYKVLYTVKASDFGVNKGQTYQSAALDFPYLYVTYGGVDGDISNGDFPVMWCIDVRSRSVMYKINYTFTAGTIIPEDEHHEAETISFYYDENGVKWLIQGFAFSHEVDDWKRRNNVLYRVRETINPE